MPSIRQGPLPRNALSSVRLRPYPTPRLGHRDIRLSTPFHPRGTFRIRDGRAPVHATPLPPGVALLVGLGAACRLLQPVFDARAHPTSVSSSHASGAFAPLLASTNRCRLRRSPRCVAASGTSKPRPARDGLTRAAFHLRGRGKSWAGMLEQRRTRVLERHRACPPRGVPGTRVTGSTRHEVWSPSRLVAPAKTHLGCRPAKGDTVGRVEVPSTVSEPLRDRRITPPCAPGPPLRHAASAEALLWSSRAFFTVPRAPAPDEESAWAGSPLRAAESRSFSGTARRSARHGFYDRIRSRADVPRTS